MTGTEVTVTEVTASQEALTPAALLARWAADPGRVLAVVEDDRGSAATVTYAGELDRARAAAGALAGLGVQAGDRIHLHTPNCREFLDAWFATSMLGAVLVPTGPQSTADELSYVLAQVSPAVSLSAPQLAGNVEQAALLAGRQPRILSLSGDGPCALPALAAQATPAAVPAGEQDATATAAILYTSGTTSRPKGVLVTSANYHAVGTAVARHLAITQDDRWLIALPLFHANAQYYCTMSALVTGASIVLAPRFSASRWARQAADHGATLGSLFAAPVRMLLAQEPSEAEQRCRLRAVLFAQNLTDEQAGSFERRYGTRLLQLYGMTETVLPPTMNPDSAQRRWHSIGRPLPGVTVRVTGEDGAPVPAGTPGELQVRGTPGVTLAAGYYQDPAATAAAFRDGWLHTGDLARIDADGFAYFVDRAKDMIKRSGENVSAGEIERVAAEHPAVAECAVVGVPDPVRDEAIVLVAVTRSGAAVSQDELIGWCAARLAAYKVPGTVVFAGALPRTSVGKIAKAQIRTQLLPDPAAPTRDPAAPTRDPAAPSASARPHTHAPAGG